MIVCICRARERGREPKGRKEPRTGGQQENTSMYDMITKRGRMARCEDTKKPCTALKLYT
jgi:hypothetical protein